MAYRTNAPPARGRQGNLVDGLDRVVVVAILPLHRVPDTHAPTHIPTVTITRFSSSATWQKARTQKNVWGGQGGGGLKNKAWRPIPSPFGDYGSKPLASNFPAVLGCGFGIQI